jgi:O-antigen/teichoic acid export membrane protein
MNSDRKLSQQIAKSGFWVFTIRFIHQFFYLARLIILARLLTPHDFGLLGIGLLAMMTLETLSQTGFQEALIQKKENVETFLNSAWTILIIRGIILFLILYFISPFISAFYNAPSVTLVIRIIGLAILLQSFSNIGVIYFQKELEFNKQFILQASGTLADFCVSVTLAILLRNVWALVWGLLVGHGVKLIVSYIVHPYRPKICFNKEKTLELFRFGKWVLGGSIIIFLLLQGDDILVGKLLGLTALGFYQIAYKISNTPATELSRVISTVTFPAYSKVQDDINKLKQYYFEILQLTAFFSFLLAGIIFTLAPEFTSLLLGNKWAPIIYITQLLSIFGLFRSLNATFGPVFYATGNPYILTKVAFYQLVVLVIIFYPLYLWGELIGISLAVTLGNFFCFILCLFKLKKILNCQIIDILKQVKNSFLAISILVLIIFLFKYFSYSVVKTIPSEAVLFFSLIIIIIPYSMFGKNLFLKLKKSSLLLKNLR